MLTLISRPAGRFLANMMLKPLPQPFPKTPADYGLSYRDVAFPTRDGLTLRGWLINEDAEKIVIMSHFGYRANRFGYQLKYQPRLSKPYNKDIEFCIVAKRLVEAGYGVLMYDLRNHGESDKTELGVGTGGKGERFDVIGAVEFIASEASTKEKPIGLLSYCYGANTTFFAFQEDADFLSRHVRALVALQPLSNGDYLKAMKLPKSIYAAAQDHYEAHSGGYPFVAPIEEATPSVTVPTRLVQARKDPFADMDKVKMMFDGIPAEKEMFWLEEPTHRFDGYNWFADHPADMLAWFDRFMA
ncbi:MAG: alpha/beta fold hydrolase [Pseudomonadota bacterium]